MKTHSAFISNALMCTWQALRTNHWYHSIHAIGASLWHNFVIYLSISSLSTPSAKNTSWCKPEWGSTPFPHLWRHMHRLARPPHLAILSPLPQQQSPSWSMAFADWPADSVKVGLSWIMSRLYGQVTWHKQSHLVVTWRGGGSERESALHTLYEKRWFGRAHATVDQSNFPNVFITVLQMHIYKQIMKA